MEPWRKPARSYCENTLAGPKRGRVVGPFVPASESRTAVELKWGVRAATASILLSGRFGDHLGPYRPTRTLQCRYRAQHRHSELSVQVADCTDARIKRFDEQCPA